MVKIDKAVFDAGPFIHLNEIDELDLIRLFSKIFTTKEILEECREIEKILRKFSNIIEENLNFKSKDFAKYLAEEYKLDLGEATGLALCRQKSIKFFFTDDLEAREIANVLGFNAHGTIAIILRSLKEKIIDKKEIYNI